MKIVATNIPQVVDEIEYSKIKNYASKKKKFEIKNYIHLKDKYRSVMGELLIKNILCFDFGYKNVEIEKDLNGKPIIKGSCNHFFNISHSGNWIICVVDTECIGIDIEKIEVIDVKKFGSIYTTNEYNRILSSNTPIELFYRLWTIKESFTKLIGRGLQIPLNDFEVYDTIEYDNEQYFYKEYSDFEGYALTICSQKNVFSSEIEIRSINNGRKEKEQNEL